MNSLKREYGDLDKLLVSASDVKIYDLLGEGILNHMLSCKYLLQLNQTFFTVIMIVGSEGKGRMGS